MQVNLSRVWPTISAARQNAQQQLQRLRALVDPIGIPENTAVVAFGSLARLEWTFGSDLDWTLLLDGPADPEHYRLVQKITDCSESAAFKLPGPTGTFGQLTSSHELIHQIGGDEDTNQNLTRRVLLLLESVPLSDAVPHQRVLNGILKRYIANDRSVSVAAQPKVRVPRFLLNDIARLWRTFAVDYAWKKWERNEKGWALRNAKLRVSRKLTFVKGLLLAFDCELNPTFPELRSPPTADLVANQLTSRCYELATATPIDVLSRVLTACARPETTIRILDAYDRFLAALDDPLKREHLDGVVAFDSALDDAVFQEVRDISHDFRNGIESLFFDEHDELKRLTRRYGVF